LVGRLKGKSTHRRPRRKWEDNIKTDVRKSKVGGFGLVSSDSGYGTVAGSCEHGNETSGYIKGREFLTRWETITFSRRTLLHEVF
jgi:hypothetical protein